MLTVSLRRKIVLLLLVAVLATPWASAASLLPESPRVAQALDSVPLVGSVWRMLRSVLHEAGCRIDPDGRCATSPPAKNPPPPQTKIGCMIDPNGRCLS
jgi:hypothetical protein